VEGSGAALPKNTWKFGGTLDIHLHVLPAVLPEGRNGAGLCQTVRRQIADEVARIRAARGMKPVVNG
jgi:hypothetical protein